MIALFSEFCQLYSIPQYHMILPIVPQSWNMQMWVGISHHLV